MKAIFIKNTIYPESLFDSQRTMASPVGISSPSSESS